MPVDLLLSRNIPFAVYRLPHSSEIVFVVQNNGLPVEFDLDKLEQQRGFVLATFDAYKNGKAFVINPTCIAKTPAEKEKLRKELLQMPESRIHTGNVKEIPVDKTGYLKQANHLIDTMKSGVLSKVVLSRIISKPLPLDFSYADFFNLLHKSYPLAFVYLFYLPGNGIWAGATPETLIKKQNDFYETMALAGTQKTGVSTEKVVWGEKEKEEQAFVSDFITTQLKKLDIDTFTIFPEETIRAGRLAHICTRFRFPRREMNNKIGQLVKALHPTPAVCGLPRDKAWTLIEKTEQHNREFYTGFLGPWNIEGKQHLFVNLRCGRFYQNQLMLYVGGGLTAQSVAEAEWQETEDKSQTLLSLVENLRNFAP